MQKIGELSEDRFNRDDILQIHDKFVKCGYLCELIDLNDFVENTKEKASILIIRDVASHFVDVDMIFKEHKGLKHDKKAFMYGKVVNKHARHSTGYKKYTGEI